MTKKGCAPTSKTPAGAKYNIEPTQDYSTSAGYRQGIASLLMTGEAHALTAKELAQINGSTARKVTKEIEMLRLRGCPICANAQGYFLPADEAELGGYIKAFNRRLKRIQATKTALDDIMIAVSGQLPIEGV